MESIASSVPEFCAPRKVATSALWSKGAAMEALTCLRELDWSWLYAALEQQAGLVAKVDQDCVLEELSRFIVIKVATCDLDKVNHLCGEGLVETAFQAMLLNPFFCAHVMRVLRHPAHVLSNNFAHRDYDEQRVQECKQLYKCAVNHLCAEGLVETAFQTMLLNSFFCAHVMRFQRHPAHVLSIAHRDDNEQRVQKCIQHYKELFGSDPPHQLPSSGSNLWPLQLLQSRGQKRKEPATLPAVVIDPPDAMDKEQVGSKQVRRSCLEIGSNSGQIFVKSLRGKTVSCSFADLHLAKVADLVLMLQDLHGIPADQLKLIWSGLVIHSPHKSLLVDGDHERESQVSLGSLGIGSGSLLHSVLTTRGHCSCVPAKARGTLW